MKEYRENKNAKAKKEVYTAAHMELIEFASEDVITASGNDLPFLPFELDENMDSIPDDEQ